MHNSGLTNEFITGTWKVTNVTITSDDIPEEEVKFMTEMTEGFKKATFKFKENHSFTLDIPIEELAANMTDVFWKINNPKDKVLIQASADDPSMDEGMFIISTTKEGDNYYFEISRMPFKMLVKKEPI